MKNETYGYDTMAVAIKDIMVMANFTGWIRQDGKALRQFSGTSVTGNEKEAELHFGFAGEYFKIQITPADPPCQQGQDSCSGDNLEVASLPEV